MDAFNLLSQVLSPHLHTAALLTPTGELVPFACDSGRPLAKDEVHIIVGLCGEVWQETRQQGHGMVDSELGRIIVLPVVNSEDGTHQVFSEEHDPLLLLALNETDSVKWKDLQTKGKALATHLATPLRKFREVTTSRKHSPSRTAAASPAPRRP